MKSLENLILQHFEFLSYITPSYQHNDTRSIQSSNLKLSFQSFDISSLSDGNRSSDKFLTRLWLLQLEQTSNKPRYCSIVSLRYFVEVTIVHNTFQSIAFSHEEQWGTIGRLLSSLPEKSSLYSLMAPFSAGDTWYEVQ